jgi:transcriptional regulator with XRE-family HTH domain
VLFVNKEIAQLCNLFLRMSFSARLQEIFDQATVAEVARILELGHSTVRNYYEGRLPSADILIKIRNHTNVSIDWLLTGEGEKLVTPVTKTLANESEVETIPAVFLSHFYNLPDEAKAAISERLITEIANYLQQPKDVKKKTEAVIEQNDFLMSDPKGANAGTKRIPAAIRKDIADAKAHVKKIKQRSS